ncbi:MAG: sigma-70 family RNA polymerase sigma factor [Chloroflexi bacterium AL-W]|nr:sigma-70 family RNA polymerase sigma factor [Chloroflexi bacterium AL-N1]NOK70836.1 sigma-70 family RNA polymerase sigma factor [Chloroflexi bacterium AL-N10]NOK78396.1 sigma-70 family RNA polymerase sigma factor [Chloroflexi bacterium AL-N5]NOK85377.1 sigma-70 family RNA polymerase sigma factor [Chloroflexi bacterium AL-W]NOK92653.1 sigma-70 family RNA polymerase sigma factor [Chloroflexi bacterium AL-N15]
MNADHERELLSRTARDPTAFEDIYDHYLPRIYAYVGVRVAQKQDVEDLVAETFVKALAGIESFVWQHEASFAAWLFRICHNLVCNFYRQSQHQKTHLSLDTVLYLHNGMDSPEVALVQKEHISQVWEWLHLLPRRQQEILMLKLFGELRNKEIAIVLGLDERTVAAHLCRGIKEIHRKYTEEFNRVLDGGTL